jgi:hypothetical protein
MLTASCILYADVLAQCYTWGANNMEQLGYHGIEEGLMAIDTEPRVVDSLFGQVRFADVC